MNMVVEDKISCNRYVDTYQIACQDLLHTTQATPKASNKSGSCLTREGLGQRQDI